MKDFNTAGKCIPSWHYMVDLTERINKIEKMVDQGKYFCINRGRQYGKTTVLGMLTKALKDKYIVFSLSFEGLGDKSFSTLSSLYRTVFQILKQNVDFALVNLSAEATELLEKMSDRENLDDADFIGGIVKLNELNNKKIVLIIDEVDQAGNYDSFIKLLGALRNAYLRRDEINTFQSVVLAGVYDVKNLKLKIRPANEHQYNSPWNIAVNFDIDLSFDKKDILTMLEDYESEHHSGTDIDYIAGLLFDYTSGYPFLVSRLCQLMAKQGETWNKEIFLSAERELLQEKNTLFDDMAKKLDQYPELYNSLYNILFKGQEITFNQYDKVTDIAKMFDYIKNNNGKVAIANRIFEVWLYNLFMFKEHITDPVYDASVDDRELFFKNGMLDMEAVLERFAMTFQNLYGDRNAKFDEDEGRKKFLLYLKPIINGTGNYYTESRTRNNRRTDVIVDYKGKQFVVELKIWRGSQYHEAGEQQLLYYMEYLKADTGYLLTFNFNKNKEVGLNRKVFAKKTIVEVFV